MRKTGFYWVKCWSNRSVQDQFWTIAYYDAEGVPPNEDELAWCVPSQFRQEWKRDSDFAEIDEKQIVR